MITISMFWNVYSLQHTHLSWINISRATSILCLAYQYDATLWAVPPNICGLLTELNIQAVIRACKLEISSNHLRRDMIDTWVNNKRLARLTREFRSDGMCKTVSVSQYAHSFGQGKSTANHLLIVLTTSACWVFRVQSLVVEHYYEQLLYMYVCMTNGTVASWYIFTVHDIVPLWPHCKANQILWP